MWYFSVHKDSFCWLGLVVLCSLWIRVLAVSMRRKFLFDLHGASLVLREIGHWDIFYVFGSSLPYLLFLPYLWQDQRTLERAKRLAPLWSGL